MPFPETPIKLTSLAPLPGALYRDSWLVREPSPRSGSIWDPLPTSQETFWSLLGHRVSNETFPTTLPGGLSITLRSKSNSSSEIFDKGKI